jgi:hypothetical protein
LRSRELRRAVRMRYVGVRHGFTNREVAAMLIDESMIGAPVLDRDGHQIGTVKEIEGSAFKVDVPLAFDYWLHFDGVQSASIDRVVMCVDRDHLDEFRLDSPEDALPHGTRLDYDTDHQRAAREVKAQSDSYGVHDGTMVGEVVAGQHPRDDVIVRSPMQGHDTYYAPDVRTHPVTTSANLDTTRDAMDRVDLPAGSLSAAETIDTTAVHGVDNGTTVESGTLHNDDIPITGVTDWGDVSARFQQDWQKEHETSDRWEEFEPGYLVGYEMAHDPRFHGRTWEEIEPDMRTEWITWSGRSGSMSDESSWDRVRTSVRKAWDSARSHRRAA